MRADTYLKKTGYIVGVSSKYQFRSWHHKVYVFNSIDKAYTWLETEECDFRERTLMSKSGAEKIIGHKIRIEDYLVKEDA